MPDRHSKGLDATSLGLGLFTVSSRMVSKKINEKILWQHRWFKGNPASAD